MHTFSVIDLGRKAYEPTLRLQQDLVRRIQDGADTAYLLLVEHDPPVITFGRRGKPENVLVAPERLAQQGIEIHHTRRGGDVTYHGPGQLVGYPILSLRHPRKKVSQYVRELEESLIRCLADFDIAAERIDGATGVWVGCEKVAAIGVAVSQDECSHGFALNVAPDLAHFDLIVPCGLGGVAVTSMSKLLGRAVPVAEVKPVVVQRFAEVFAAEATPMDPDRLPPASGPQVFG